MFFIARVFNVLLVVVVLLFATIFNKDKIVDNIDDKIEEEIKNTKKVLKKRIRFKRKK